VIKKLIIKGFKEREVSEKTDELSFLCCFRLDKDEI